MGVKRKQHSAEFKARVAMAALSGEKTLTELSAEFGVHPTMISTWKQELVKRAGELFGRGSKAPAAEDAQKVIDDLGPEGRVYDRRHPEDLGCLLGFLQRRAEKIARTGHAPRLRSRFPSHDQRRRSQQDVQHCPDGVFTPSRARGTVLAGVVRRAAHWRGHATPSVCKKLSRVFED